MEQKQRHGGKERSAAEQTDVVDLAASVARIATFAGTNLASRIAQCEFEVAGLEKAHIAEWLGRGSIDQDLLVAARTIKRSAAQIDVVLHALGILLLLPEILEGGEVVESLSLGAGSSKQSRFDLETNRRVAEFTFIDWRGNDNTRLQKIFKDFYRLAEFATNKKKELWVTEDGYVLKYLMSGSSIRSATHKNRDVWECFQAKYPLVEGVKDYYRLHAGAVSLKVYDRDIAD
ncbi:MAG TPA: hypothetical protein VIH88_02555 [Candidatus Acidoferrales bacterium]